MPAKKSPAPRKPSSPRPTAREAERMGRRLARALEILKGTRQMLRGIEKLEAKYTRQLKAARAGRKALLGKERALDKEIAALRAAGARLPRRGATD